MSVANRLYDVGHGVLGTVSPLLGTTALYISGSFPDIPATFPFEGRLQIHNAIGDCTVKLLSGDLPGGYNLSVDNTTSEVVLTWPAHGVSTTLPNNNFALGDTGYDKGAGWSIVQGDNTLDPDDPGNSWEGLFVHQIGESAMMSQTFVPCTGGKTYTASIDVQTGNAREHSHGAAVRLLFYDVAGNKLTGGKDGNVVKQTTGNEWAKSSVSVRAPDRAQFIKGGFSSYRMHQDYALWVDNFQWDVEGNDIGTSSEGLIPLSLTVKDSAGRTADWSGSITIGPVATIIANLNFNTSIDDDTTGRVWTVTPYTNLFSGKTFPQISTSGAKEGKALLLNIGVDGFTGSAADRPELYSEVGGSGIPAGIDFCAEGFISIDCLPSTFGNNNCWFFTFPKIGRTLLIRNGSYHNPSYGDAYYFSSSADPSVFPPVDSSLDLRALPGDVHHWAITRQGSTMNHWWDGQLSDTYAATGTAILPTDKIRIGNIGDISVSGAPTIPGSVDDIRITLNWARYTAPFAPPIPPYE